MLIIQKSKDKAYFNNKLEYVINVYNTIYSLKNPVYIGYQLSQNTDIIIHKTNAFNFFSNHKPEPDEIRLFDWNGKKLLALFNCDMEQELMTEITNHSLRINFDILYSAFYFLSCWQEFKNKARDKFGRFPASQSLLYHYDLIQSPVVNYYFEILNVAIEKITNQTPINKGGRTKSFTVSVTHDIDQCHSGWKENAAFNLRSLHFRKAGQHLINKLFKKNIWYNFNEIMEIEAQLQLKSNFFFIPTKKPYKNINNADYDLNSAKYKSVLKHILKNGNQIGIHNSYGSGFNFERFKHDLARFPIKIMGGRFHYLSFDAGKSFEFVEKSGLHYDSSLGFAEAIGFRNGFCQVFKPYNLEKDVEHTFWEFPITIMDTTLLHKKYLGYSPETALEQVKPLIMEVIKFNGILVLLWHNSSFSGEKHLQWKRVFIDIILFCKQQNASFNTLEEIVALNV